jgi:POT family proton-dependent oligopeptide transporter
MYYMGVNAGAFLGIMLCGYIGEKFLGVGVWISRRFVVRMLQFYFTQDIFGDIGLKPTAASKQKSRRKLQRILL